MVDGEAADLAGETPVVIAVTVVTLTLGRRGHRRIHRRCDDCCHTVSVSYSHTALNQFGHPRPSNSRLLTALNADVNGRNETVDPFNGVQVRNDNPPVLVVDEDGGTGVTVDGKTVTLTFNARLRGNPESGAFTVGGGTLAERNAVRVSGNTVTLTLAAAVTAGDDVTVGYTAP